MPAPRTRPAREHRSLLIRATGLALIGAALLPATASAGALSPDSPASPNASEAQTIWWVMLALGTVLAVGVIVALLLAVRGRLSGARAAPGERRTRGTRGVQLRVGGALGLLAVAIFVLGVVFTERATDVEAVTPEGEETLEIKVTGQRWLWRYEYPASEGELRAPFSYHELVVPVDRTVELEIDSVDVVHRWWLPALGGMFDAVPGQANRTWFRAEETGTFEGRSTEFSGAAYPTMRARVRVVTEDEFGRWLEQQASEIAAAQQAIAATREAEADEEAGE